MGGLIGVGTINKAGLMPTGLFYQFPNNIYINPHESFDLGKVNGFVGIYNPYSWNGYEIYWCSGGIVTRIAGANYSISHSITYNDGKWILTNSADNKRAFRIFVQNIPT